MLQVSTHATRAGRDFLGAGMQKQMSSFNSRDPCGSRRENPRNAECYKHCFNSRDPCGSRRDGAAVGAEVHRVSTHATRAGRDWKGIGDPSAGFVFQLTRPVRVATADLALDAARDRVSTHATRAGRDLVEKGV